MVDQQSHTQKSLSRTLFPLTCSLYSLLSSPLQLEQSHASFLLLGRGETSIEWRFKGNAEEGGKKDE